ncbi:arylsulfatase [Sandaracinus amylolyticus]|uniref:Sulfatase n=1 Tax=Sandaracinus amylolyticus TaxID=927083 RepID=A0A0F6W3T9_9BACT|nr:arylsulfatase [Sandaracinus amylolyticus]AKF06762.1 Sulfatase precursor [Sandaracinus amylolyticus]
MASDYDEYEPGKPFPGRIGMTVDESTPAWPAYRRAKDGAPNVLIFVLDDVGFGQLSCFGGLCETPNLDRLASRGLRYTNMQTTALCSPTRGALLTGRNHHTLGLSAITELSMGFPAHNGMVGFEHGFLSEMLLEHGYNTFAVGKWHLAPPEETTQAGPFTRWPLGRGFERYYGFLGGDTDQWHPDLTEDNRSVTPPRTPEEGYHLNVDLADRAIRMIQDADASAPEKPFFLYYATGAGHAPHHVEKSWIDRYRGRFDMGWDAYREQVFARQLELGVIPAGTTLSTRDPDVPAWDTLSADEKRMYARQMEVYAAFLSQTDHHFGRILDYLERIGELENTLVVAISDNGASAEGGVHGTFNEMLFFNGAPERLEDNLRHYDDWGGPDTFPHYAWGWTWAGDTPFRRWKRETYRGGTSDPCIVSWPRGIPASGEIRTQYLHVIDIVPTILETLGLEPPSTIRGVTQSPIEGVSFAHTLHDAAAPTKHVTQYFEMFGHRAIHHDGWRAVCPFPGPSLTEGASRGWLFGRTSLTREVLEELDRSGWELYHLDEDPSETRNVAAEHPEILRSMTRRWYVEAGRYGVMPLAAGDVARMNVPRPTVARPRDRYVLQPGGAPIPFAAAPRIYNRPHSITAKVRIPAGGAEGVLLAHGNRHGGYSLYVAEGRLHHVHNYLGLHKMKVSSNVVLPSGEHTLRYEFEPTGAPDLAAGKGVPGRSQLYLDGRLVGSAMLPFTVPNVFGIAGLSCGRDHYDAVVPSEYRAPFPFTGELVEVVIDLSGELTRDHQRDIDRLMAQQ